MKKLIITKSFTFEAAHQLPDEECYEKCRNLHGHSYKLFVKVQGVVGEKGWVMNFSEIKKIVQKNIIEPYDHCFLNEKLSFITTAENLVIFMAEIIEKELPENIELIELELFETATASAIWRKS